MRIIEMPSAEVILGRIESAEHRKNASMCGPCGLDVTRVGLPELVYFFGECDCSEVDYLHLTEHVWHRGCFVAEFDTGETDV